MAEGTELGGAVSAAQLLSRSPRSTMGYTVADLHALPDNGPRYELIDGSIIVSPSATTGHNVIAHWLVNILESSNPDPHYLASADHSVTVDDHNEPRPDIVVAHVSVLNVTPFPVEKLKLAVEVVLPTSVLRDTATKRALYARAGVPAYWIVVPERDPAGIRVAELRLDEAAGEYTYRTPYTSEAFSTDHPWPVTVDVPALVDRWAALVRLAAEAGDERS